MDLSIIIVNWNVKSLLEKCLISIQKYLTGIKYEIIVVDNASQDGSQEFLRDLTNQGNPPSSANRQTSADARFCSFACPPAGGLRLIQNRRNLGFAKANNQVLKIAQGEFILFLNPDTELLDNSLTQAIDFMKQNSRCGILGGQILGEDNEAPRSLLRGIKRNPPKPPALPCQSFKGFSALPSSQQSAEHSATEDKIQLSARNFPKLCSQVLILLKLHRLFSGVSCLNKYFLPNFDYRQTQEVDQVMGAFLLTRKSLLDNLGGFDEKFFLWFEEVDLCWRVKESGYQIIYYPLAKIKHYGRQSFVQVLPWRRQKNYNCSLIYFFIKHYPAWQVIILIIIFPLSWLLSLPTLLFRNHYGPRQF